MSGNNYQIIFEGKLLPGFAIDVVKKNISALFKMNEEQVEKIFTGNPVIIKKNTDEQTALKYQAAFRKSGAECLIQNDELTAQTPPPAPVSTSPENSDAATPRMIRGTRDVVNLAVPNDLGELSLAATGSMILSAPTEPPVFDIDISHLTLAELESGYLAEQQQVEPAKIEGLSNLKLEPL